MKELTKEQKVLMQKHESLTSFVVMLVANNQHEFCLADSCAKMVLREAVVNYDSSCGEDFESFAEKYMEKRLKKLIRKSAKPIHRLKGESEWMDKDYFRSGEEVLQQEFNNILHEAGLE